MSNVSNSPTLCGLSAPLLNSVYGSCSNGLVRFKFNREVANFRIKAAGFDNNCGNDIVYHHPHKNGQRVYPTTTPTLSRLYK